MNPMKRFFVYVLRCSDNSLYCGWTTNVSRRIMQHETGKGAKYFRRNIRIEENVFVLIFDSKSKAMKMEAWLKKQTKKAKEFIIMKSISNVLVGNIEEYKRILMTGKGKGLVKP